MLDLPQHVKEQIWDRIDPVLSKEIPAFFFVLFNAIGAFLTVVGGFYLVYKTVVLLGAY